MFIHDMGKRKSILQKLVEETEACLDRQIKYNHAHKLLDDRNSYLKTDLDVTFMHIKDDHM